MLSTSQVEKICVVGGLGPAGLAYIASMKKIAKKRPDKQYDITVFDIRGEEFKRRQPLIDLKPGVLLGEDTWESFIVGLFDSKNLINAEGHLVDNKNTSVEISSLNASQKFIRNMLRQSVSSTCREVIIKNFSIKSVQRAMLSYIKDTPLSNFSVNIRPETTIDKINLRKKLLFARSKNDIQPYEFDTLVISEGRHRQVTKLVNIAIKDENLSITPFQFEIFPYQLPRHNVACFLTIKPSDKVINFESYLKELRGSYSLSLEEVKERLSLLGWHPSTDNIQLPLYIADNNFYKGKFSFKHWKPEIFIASELPECIMKIKDHHIKHQNALEWVKILASYQLQLPKDCLNLPLTKNGEDDLSALTLFKTRTKYVTNPVMTLPKGKITLLGETGMTSVYQIGKSSGIYLNLSKILAQCIAATCPEETRFDPFLNAYQEYKDKIENLLSNSPYSKLFNTQSSLLFYTGNQQDVSCQADSSQICYSKT